jgi:hypothetical protein
LDVVELHLKKKKQKQEGKGDNIINFGLDSEATPSLIKLNEHLFAKCLSSHPN